MSYRIGLLDVDGCVLSYDYVSSDLSFEPSQILVQKDHCRDSISQLKYSRCLRLKAKKKESPHNIAQTLGDLNVSEPEPESHQSHQSLLENAGEKKTWPKGQNVHKPQVFFQTISQLFWASSKKLTWKKQNSKINRHQIIWLMNLSGLSS